MRQRDIEFSHQLPFLALNDKINIEGDRDDKTRKTERGREDERLRERMRERARERERENKTETERYRVLTLVPFPRSK